MKKISLFLALILAAVPLGALAASFPDVQSNKPFYAAVEYLKANNVVNGYPDGTFKPDQVINRVEALKITMLAKEFLGEKLTLTDLLTITYPDVGKNDWYYNYVNLATNAKIVEGYPDGSFKPATTINAVESLKIVLKALDTEFEEKTISNNPYNDVKFNEWYATYVDYAKRKNLIEARENYQFFPARGMTRGDFVDLVYRLTFIKKNQLETFPISQNWAYCNNYQENYKIKVPFNWQKYVAGKQFILWYQDKQNGQVSFARAYPNSATVIVAIDENAKNTDLNTYVNGLDYGTNAEKQFLTLNGLPYAAVLLKDSGFQDSYFKLSNGNVLIVYSQFGTGAMTEQLKEDLRYVLGSIRESNSASDASENCYINNATSNSSTVNNISSTEQVLAKINPLVLVKGAAAQAIALLTDNAIIETDTLGVGTGPVDYHYSSLYNLTLKIERNTATILAVKREKTTKF